MLRLPSLYPYCQHALGTHALGARGCSFSFHRQLALAQTPAAGPDNSRACVLRHRRPLTPSLTPCGGEGPEHTSSPSIERLGVRVSSGFVNCAS